MSYDTAMKGGDPVDSHPGPLIRWPFTATMAITKIIVETANRNSTSVLIRRARPQETAVFGRITDRAQIPRVWPLRVRHPHFCKIALTTNWFWRDLKVQETGYALLKQEGVALIAADDPDAFTVGALTVTIIRKILGSVAQFRKRQGWASFAGPKTEPVKDSGNASRGEKGILRPVPNWSGRQSAYAAKVLRRAGGAAYVKSQQNWIGWDTATKRATL